MVGIDNILFSNDSTTLIFSGSGEWCQLMVVGVEKQ